MSLPPPLRARRAVHAKGTRAPINPPPLPACPSRHLRLRVPLPHHAPLPLQKTVGRARRRLDSAHGSAARATRRLQELREVEPYPSAVSLSPAEHRSTAIWRNSTGHHGRPPVRPSSIPAASIRLPPRWAHLRDPLNLLSLFCISPMPLAARNPADLKRHGQVPLFLCMSKLLSVPRLKEEDKVVLWLDP
jgi:hypothetical protein